MRGWIRKALLVGGKRQVAGDIEERNPTIQIHPPPGCQLYVPDGHRYATKSDVRRRSRAADSEAQAVEVE